MVKKGFKAQSQKERIIDRNSLINSYQEFADNVVKKLCRHLSLPLDNFDEYQAAGYLGLVEAAERYKPSKTADFRSFAFLRIRGAVIDSIRKSGSLPASAYRKIKFLEAAHQLSEDRFGSSDTLNYAAPEMFLGSVFEYLEDVVVAHEISSHANDKDKGNITYATKRSPEDILLEQDRSHFLLKLIDKLPKEERKVVKLYYYEQLSYQEIVEKKKISSKTLISRLHKKALRTLSKLYTEQMNPVSNIYKEVVQVN